MAMRSPVQAGGRTEVGPRPRAHKSSGAEKVSACIMPPMRYLEDFKEGQVFELGEGTIREQQIIDFARRFDAQPFHADPEAAKESIYGGLIAALPGGARSRRGGGGTRLLPALRQEASGPARNTPLAGAAPGRVGAAEPTPLAARRTSVGGQRHASASSGRSLTIRSGSIPHG